MAVVTDHLGISYSSFAEMCRHYDKDVTLVRARLRYNWDIESALTTDSNKYNGKVTDHEGNSFDNVFSMCKKYGIDKAVYFHRINDGWDAVKALTTPVIRRDIKCYDHLGNEFRTKDERAKYYGLSSATIEARLAKGWSLEKALTTHREISYQIGNDVFKNVRDAGNHFGISRTTIAKIVKETEDPVERLEKVRQVLRSPSYQRWQGK